VLPIVLFGMTALSKLQVWTQPVWLILITAPFLAIAVKEPGTYRAVFGFGGQDHKIAAVTLAGFGLSSGIVLSLIAQIGEQVDFLRFMPDKTTANRRAWWASVITAGPGWVVFSVLKLFGGVFLAFYVADRAGFSKAVEPVQQYLHATGAWLPAGALGVAVFFVVLSQLKINTTNAYSGSLSFANFFSRTLHRHPGRAIWVLLHLAIALTLMEVGIFAFLNFVLGFFSNVGIAWIGAIVADLVINKPLGLSPSYIEFKRAHLCNFNPVGFGSMLLASAVAIAAFFGAFGGLAHALAPFIALVLAMTLSPLIAWLTGGRYYIARADELDEPLLDPDGLPSAATYTCIVCGTAYERPDVAACPHHDGVICSLCCSLEAHCHDTCKSGLVIDLGIPAPRNVTHGGGQLAPR
jgi:purine-cytosine permease-like protein